jgi:hypothetical protein
MAAKDFMDLFSKTPEEQSEFLLGRILDLQLQVHTLVDIIAVLTLRQTNNQKLANAIGKLFNDGYEMRRTSHYLNDPLIKDWDKQRLKDLLDDIEGVHPNE